MVADTQTGHGRKEESIVIYLVGLVGSRHKNATFPPAVALVATERP